MEFGVALGSLQSLIHAHIQPLFMQHPVLGSPRELTDGVSVLLELSELKTVKVY